MQQKSRLKSDKAESAAENKVQAASKQSGWSRYRGLLISVLLFILVDASVLLSNMYIASLMPQDSLGVNLSGRQRMLSQRMTKAILSIGENQNERETWQKSVEELKLTQNLFGTTLQGFDHGETVTDATGGQSYLKGVSTPDARTAVQSALVIWQPYTQLIDQYLYGAERGVHDEGQFVALREYALANNLTLLKHMNDLTVDLEHVANRKSALLRYIQIIGLVLASLNFGVAVFYSFRRLRTSDREIQAAREETQRIMSTVREGLFLIGPDLAISGEYSRHLESIVGQKNLGGTSLITMLESLVDAETIRQTRTFIKQLFSPKVLQDLITDLNPLKEVSVKMQDEQGNEVERYLNFQFNRVYSGKSIEGILISVVDITQQILLEQRLDVERQEADRQVEMLGIILKTNPQLLNSFIANCVSRLNTINKVLENPGTSQNALRQKVQEIYREMHSIKGEASALNMHGFVSKAEEFELKAKQLNIKKNLSGIDFLSLAVVLNELLDLTQLVSDLNSRIGGALPQTQDAGGADMKGYFKNFIATMAKRNGKEIRFAMEGWEHIPTFRRDTLKDIAIQLLRNAVVHGIETPEERLQADKPAQGKISLTVSRPDKAHALMVIEDDGNGINLERIRRKAVERGIAGAEEIQTWNKQKLIGLIFQSEFSTAETASEDAGKGVGMDVIRDRVQKLNGKLSIATTEGVMTRFSILFPVDKR